MNYTKKQVCELEEEFKKNIYISKQRRIELSHSIQVTEQQIVVWFQNRRSKLKKNTKALRKAEETKNNSSRFCQPENHYVNNFMFTFSGPTHIQGPMTSSGCKPVTQSMNLVLNSVGDYFTTSNISFPMTSTLREQVNQSVSNSSNFSFPVSAHTGMFYPTEGNIAKDDKNTVLASQQWPSNERYLNQQYFNSNHTSQKH